MKRSLVHPMLIYFHIRTQCHILPYNTYYMHGEDS